MASMTKPMTDPTTFLFTHSPKLFVDADDLVDYLNTRLRKMKGRYRVVSWKKYQRPQTGHVVLFHKDRKIVGEAVVADPVRERHEHVGGVDYEGYLVFDSKTIRVYRVPVSFDQIERVLRKKLTSRTPCQNGDKVYDVVRRVRGGR
jgi:hypothetical protein